MGAGLRRREKKVVRLLFAGTPSLAVSSLQVLSEKGPSLGLEVVGVLSAPDKRGKRGSALHPSPVKKKALELGLPVLTPDSLKSEARELARTLEPDLLVVFAYGKIFGPKFLALFPKGAVNVHPSLLPAHRGPSPLVATILSQDKEWGYSIQEVAAKMDEGDLYLQRSFPLEARARTSDLEELCSEKVPSDLLAILSAIEKGTAVKRAQGNSGVSYCHMITKSDAQLSWDDEPSHIDAQIRAYFPSPTAYTFFREKRIFILSALQVVQRELGPVSSLENGALVIRRGEVYVKVQSGAFKLESVKAESKKETSGQDFANTLDRKNPGCFTAEKEH